MANPATKKAWAGSWIKVGTDLAIWTVACILAFPLRAPFGWIELIPVMGGYALVGVLIKLPLILRFRLHRPVWRHVTVEDARGLALVVAVGSGALFVIGLAWHRAGIPFPRTVPIIEGVLALLGMAGVRISARMWEARKDRARAPAFEGTPRRVLLVGAGEAGTHIGWEIRRRPASGLVAVGFLDDYAAHAHRSVAGTQILGRIEDLPRVVREHRIDEVFITMPSAGGRETRRIAELARSARVDCRILPAITQVLSGDATLAGVRPVQVEDLLRREPIVLEPAGLLHRRPHHLGDGCRRIDRTRSSSDRQRSSSQPTSSFSVTARPRSTGSMRNFSSRCPNSAPPLSSGMCETGRRSITSCARSNLRSSSTRLHTSMSPSWKLIRMRPCSTMSAERGTSRRQRLKRESNAS